MGTSNFYYKNASKVYAVCMPYEDFILDGEGNETDEKETRHPETFEVNDTLDFIRERLSETKNFDCDIKEGWNNNTPRSFPSENLATWTAHKIFGGVSVSIVITAVANSGYYEGACLDWFENIYVAGYERDKAECDDFEYYGNLNKGISTIIAGAANKWITKTKTAMVYELEKVFDSVSEVKLQQLATMSNGEGVYKQIV